MENATYVFNITSEAVTDVTVTSETTLSNGVTQNDVITVDQTTATIISLEMSTGSYLSGISSSHQTTVQPTNQTGFSTQSIDDFDINDYTDIYYEDEYMYPGYAFEKPFYLYFWEFLVIFTFLFNLIVISVLLRRKMRNATNIVLIAIAISDSLTGLVTLPSYIMVFARYVPPGGGDYENNYTYYEQTTPSQYEYEGNYSYNEKHEAVGGCELTKELCNGFMISKYFFSKSFHSMSIFLTLFLGIQRYISIRYPYRSQLLLSLPKTIIWCVTIVLVSPILHIYHLLGERASDGMCQWELEMGGCGGGCIYLFFSFFIRHLIPCVALTIFTTLFILQLKTGEKNLCRMDSSKSQLSRRKEENRRISIVVIAVVLVFLIPEIPYGVFLLYNAIEKAANQGKGIDLETNRAIHLVYELLLVLSFHANFYVYTFFNRRFRKNMYRIYLKPFRRYLGDSDRLSVSTGSFSRQTSNRKTGTGSAVTRIEMESMIKTAPPGQPEIQTNSAASSLVDKDQTVFEGDRTLL